MTRTIADWGTADGYFATAEDAERFYDELTCALRESVRLVQFAGLVQRRPVPPIRHHGPREQLAMGRRNANDRQGRQRLRVSRRPRPASSRASATTWKTSCGWPQRGHAVQVRLGTGTDLRPSRSSQEKLSGGGKPSGPVSFMRVYDAIAAVVKSGGKTRRAAKMQTLKDWHPDILEFIECKTKEEQKARTLIASGIRGQFQRRSL